MEEGELGEAEVKKTERQMSRPKYGLVSEVGFE